MSTKVSFRRAEVSFLWRKSVLRDVRMQSCLALRFLVTFRPPLHEIFAFLSNIRPRLACMRTSRKTDFRWNKDFRSPKNNFRGHDISQGLDREPPSLFPHFLLWSFISCDCSCRGHPSLISKSIKKFPKVLSHTKSKYKRRHDDGDGNKIF